jgi:hypothetical protein
LVAVTRPQRWMCSHTTFFSFI